MPQVLSCVSDSSIIHSSVSDSNSHNLHLQFDSENASRQVWYSEGIIGEPTFVPRLGYEGRDYGDEDDGYILVQLYHPGKHLTSFCVLDAKNIEKGCIAKINLKHHVPYGFHGNFSPEVFVTPIVPQVKSRL